jgi:hypothetical protein
MRESLTVGKPFGRGVVLDPDAGRRGRRVLVRLRCAPERGGCGTVYETVATNLRNGDCRSCGCLQREASYDPTTHGLSRHPLYSVWLQMRHRCENPRHHAYARYGGRGITVWGPWHDPARFIADVEAEIGPRPPGRTPGGRPLYTLDRRNNDEGYRPGNIRWATWAQQRRNQQRSQQCERVA